MLHVARRELERKFEMVLFTESARIKPKSSANESQHPDLPPAPSSVVVGAVLRKLCRVEDVACPPPEIGAKI
jgi:hypothetical protein